MVEAVRAIRRGLRAQAVQQGETFASIGVALDWEVDKGTDYLERFGPFDEIMAGRSWVNSGALKFIWSEGLGGEASIPQIVVLERTIDTPGDFVVRLRSERVRYRRAGGDQIVNWGRLAFGGNG